MSLKKELFLGILLQLLLLIFLLISDQIQFATNDDTTMVAIASGGYGQPSEYVVNMHIVLGKAFKFLFNIFPNINWITVFYIFSYVIGVFQLDYLVSITYCSKWERVIAFSIITLCFFICINHFTFTVLAYWCGMIAFVSFFAIDFSKKEFGIVIVMPFIFAFLAVLIRAEVIKSLSIIYLAVSINKSINNKMIYFFMLSLMGISICSHNYMMNSDNKEKSFYQWGEIRSEALDCKQIPYDKEKFDVVGISEAQYEALYGAFYYCYDSVNIDVLSKLIELNGVSNKYNLDLYEYYNYKISQHKNILEFDNIHVLLFYCVVIIMSSRKNKSLIVRVLFFTIITEFIFWCINRPLYRVVMPGYIFSSLVLLFSRNIKFNVYKKSTVVILMLLFSFSYLCSVKTSMLSPVSTVHKEVRQYMIKYENKVFLAGNPSVFSIGVTDSIWSVPLRWNLMGNWEIYSVPYLYYMETYHGDVDPKNILYSAINNNDILILTSEGDLFVTKSKWILELINQYYDKDCHFEKFDVVAEDKNEHWVVYRLIETKRMN